MVKKKSNKLVQSGALKKAREEAVEYAVKKGMKAYHDYAPIAKRKMLCAFRKKK